MFGIPNSISPLINCFVNSNATYSSYFHSKIFLRKHPMNTLIALKSYGINFLEKFNVSIYDYNYVKLSGLLISLKA